MSYSADALIEAAQSDEHDRLEELLRQGLDPDACDARGFSALHYAVRCNSARCVEKLLAFDADVCAEDGNGATPLHFAAARPASDQVMRYLLVASADVHASDRNGWTPLHYAAIRGHESVLPPLLESVEGAVAICALDNNGCTPLHWSAMHGHRSFVESLLRDANQQVVPQAIGAKNKRGQTAAELSCVHKHSAVQRLLDSWKPAHLRPPAPQPRRRGVVRGGQSTDQTDGDEVAELKNRFGIGEAAIAMKLVIQLRRKAAAAAAARGPQQDTTASLPRSPLQRCASRHIVSFDAPGSGVTIHQSAIPETRL